jgi:hypothetical protein
MISHKYKGIFVAIPKTGSTSICGVLKKEEWNYNFEYKSKGKRHTSAIKQQTYFQNNNYNYNAYFKFAFVRNPWDRCLSAYRWLVRTERLANVTFGKFMKNYFNDVYPRPKYSQKMGSQSSWITDKNSNLIVDFVGKLENLQEDFNIVCDKIGIPPQELPHRNSTKHKHYTEYYDDELREIVAKKYAKDIEYFGYKFGE